MSGSTATTTSPSARWRPSSQIPEYRLRRLINQRLGYRNFNVFLNEHRIDEAKAALADPSQAEVPVITIAMDAGFQSLGPFNRAFKATTGVTPTEYRRLKASAASLHHIGITVKISELASRVAAFGQRDFQIRRAAHAATSPSCPARADAPCRRPTVKRRNLISHPRQHHRAQRAGADGRSGPRRAEGRDRLCRQRGLHRDLRLRPRSQRGCSPRPRRRCRAPG